jgi:hypothetical protein
MPIDDVLSLVDNEIIWRLSKDKCETCGRGNEAHDMPATALSQLKTQLTRIEMARAKNQQEERQETLLNPLSLAASIAKLPPDNPTRQSMLLQLEEQMVELDERLKELRRERPEASPSERSGPVHSPLLPAQDSEA